MSQSLPTVLITGCSTGIGRALAEEFNRQKFQVFATARNIESLAGLEQKGVRIHALDVNNPEQITAVNHWIEAEAGHLDFLINNAGYAAIGPLTELPLPELRQQFETNVLAPIVLIQTMLPLLRKASQGRIVNIGSISGIFVTPFAGAYCASKAALHALSEALRVELAPFNIQIIIVQPGAIRSHFGETAQKQVAQNLKVDSMYHSIQAAIRARAMASQENPTSAEVFARKLVKKITREKPPTVIRIGHGSSILPFLKRWLPDCWLDAILSKSH